MSINETAWNWFYKLHPKGGPWDTVDFSPDQHVVDFINFYNLKNSRILDSGCADGRNAKFLNDQGHEVVAIDISEEVINRASDKFPQIKFYNLNLLDLIDIPFDAIVDAGALHVNHPDSYGDIFRKYSDLLKPNGLLFIRIFNNEDTAKIFDVSFDMPVYGMDQRNVEALISDSFCIENILYDKNYGAHGKGCNYYYMKKL